MKRFSSLLIAIFVLSILNTIVAVAKNNAVDSNIGLWGYKQNIRLCKDANELFQAYVDVKKIPDLKKAINSGEDEKYTMSISFPKAIKFVAPISDDIWLFPKWACRNPLVKSEVKDDRLIISHTFSSKTMKIVNGRYGFGFLTKTVKRGSLSKVIVSLSNNGSIIETEIYNLELLPPIKGSRPEKLLVQLAYYPQFSEDLLKKTFAENTINAGFNDLMVIHNGSPWQNMKDVVMMRKSGMRIIVNFFTSGIFKKFPFDKYPEWNETDKDGKIKMRHRDLDMQKIIDREPVIINYLEEYFANLKNVYNIDGIQMDEERSPLGGFTKVGIEAFRKWAGFKPEVELDVNSIKNNHLEMWISFRNRQVAKTFDVIQEAFYSSCGKMPMGYYGAPQVDFGKNYSWAHKHYVACWYLLQGRPDWAGAGYDFSMATMKNTYDKFGEGHFIPWYMVTENYNEKWRRYRKISANIVQHLIASGMNGFTIWYYILDNGAFYDIATVNNMLSEHEELLVEGIENPALLALNSILPGDMTKTAYSKNGKHVAILTNIEDKDFSSSFFWRGCNNQTQTTLRYSDGKTVVLKANEKLTIPAKSFITLTTAYDAEKVDFAEIEENAPFEAVFTKAGEKSFFLKNHSKIKNCEISARVTLDTDSDSFGELGIIVRDSGKEKIFGGVILSKKIVWAQAKDMGCSKEKAGSSNSNYIRHGKSMKTQKINLTVRDENVTLKIGGKEYKYKTAIKKPGRVGFMIKANAAGKCLIENFKILNLQEKDKGEKAKPAKERRKRELRKGEPQV